MTEQDGTGRGSPEPEVSDGEALVREFSSREEAEEAARALLRRGVAPIVRPVEGAKYALLVLAHELGKARAALGLEGADNGESVSSMRAQVPAETTRTDRRRLLRNVLLYVALVLVVSVAVFLATVWLLGGFEPEPSLSEIRSQLGTG